MNHLEIENELTEKKTADYVDWQIEGAKAYIKIIMDAPMTQTGAMEVLKAWEKLCEEDYLRARGAWDVVGEKTQTAAFLIMQDPMPTGKIIYPDLIEDLDI